MTKKPSRTARSLIHNTNKIITPLFCSTNGNCSRRLLRSKNDRKLYMSRQPKPVKSVDDKICLWYRLSRGKPIRFMENFIQKITADVRQGYAVNRKEALKLASASGSDLNFLFAGASKIREHFKGNTISLCSIINAKSGRCSENCVFCAQSSWHKTSAPVYPLAGEKDILSHAEEAERIGAQCFGIITSGSGIKPEIGRAHV